jgi:hypothetical protein
MGVSKTITVACDFKGCKNVLTWSETEAAAGRQQPPEESLYLVLVTINGTNKSFCCQLHAAEYFLPPGYEAKQKHVIEFPSNPEELKNKWDHESDKPMELRSEKELGYVPGEVPIPDNGQEGD